MPQLPSFLAERAERWFGLPSQVAHAEPLSQHFRQVRFAGHSLKNRHWSPGHEIEFRVEGGALRHYTPARYDLAAGEIDVLFFLHGKGPGSEWAAQLLPKQNVLVMGPGNGGMSLAEGDWHLFLGDETAVGAFQAMTTGVKAPVLGAVEVVAGEEPTVARLLPNLAPVSRHADHGAALDAWLAKASLPPGRGAIYLLGHAQSIQRQRAALLARGINRKQIKTRAYWADGKHGL